MEERELFVTSESDASGGGVISIAELASVATPALALFGVITKFEAAAICRPSFNKNDMRSASPSILVSRKLSPSAARLPTFTIIPSKSICVRPVPTTSLL